MKALVTGAGGFIGSHLVALLLARGWQVRALVHYQGRGQWGWLEEQHTAPPSGMEVLLGDVTDAFQMDQAVAGCDVVFHLAALIGIPYSYEAPASYVATNIGGTLNLLQAARRHGVRRFIHTSTSEVYGTARYTPIDEAHPLCGQSPYAATKIGADALVESYFRAFALPIVTVRPFNTYGPRQSARAVIPTIITQALRGPKVHLGDLSPVRDLTYVTDTAAGFLAAATAGDAAVGQTINLGTGEAVTIGALSDRLLALIGTGAQVVCQAERVRPAASEVLQLVSCNTKARTLLGWAPQVPLQDGLHLTVDWLRQHLDAYAGRSYAR